MSPVMPPEGSRRPFGWKGSYSGGGDLGLIVSEGLSDAREVERCGTKGALALIVKQRELAVGSSVVVVVVVAVVVKSKEQKRTGARPNAGSGFGPDPVWGKWRSVWYKLSAVNVYDDW